MSDALNDKTSEVVARSSHSLLFLLLPFFLLLLILFSWSNFLGGTFAYMILFSPSPPPSTILLHVT